MRIQVTSWVDGMLPFPSMITSYSIQSPSLTPITGFSKAHAGQTINDGKNNKIERKTVII
jgi:hypothetical protein